MNDIVKAAKKAYAEKLKKWKKELKVKSENKFHAHADGGKHSKLEKSVEGIIRMRELAGEIKLIGAQHKLTFYIGDTKILSYIPDFYVQDLKTGEHFFIEAKGESVDSLWQVKKALWKVAGPAKLEIWVGSAARPFLKEIIKPGLAIPGVRAI